MKSIPKYVMTFVLMLLPVSALQPLHCDAAPEQVHTGYIGEEDIKAESIYGSEEMIAQSGDVDDAYYRTEKLPKIMDQGSYNTCWAVTVTSLMEISLMQKGYQEQDLSEMHLAYYAYHAMVDPLGGLAGDDYYHCGQSASFMEQGGNFTIAVHALNNWLGAAEESLVPYTSNSKNVMVTNGLPKDYAFRDVAYLKSYYAVDPTSIRDIKNAVVNYGAVAVSCYSDMSLKSSSYYNAKTYGFYCKQYHQPNHGVVIVGWDDNYSAQNFVSKPEGNGAWIARNSWGGAFGDKGYFYISYYDKGFTGTAVALDAVVSDTYAHSYQYDGSVFSTDVSDAKNRGWIKAANLFTAQGNYGGGEEITAVSFETSEVNCSYQIDIYRGVTDSANPESGVLWLTRSGETSYAGKHTVTLTAPVYVDQGEQYAVVVTLYQPQGVSIKAEKAKNTSYMVAKTAALSGQSFVYLTEKEGWSDYGKENQANIRIKAFTVNREVDAVQKKNGSLNGLAQASDNNWYLYQNGYIARSYTGLANRGNDWWYVENGKINFGYNGLVQFGDVWWYVENGKINFGYNGLTQFGEAWWYVENGKVNFDYNGFVLFGDVWWCIAGGRVAFEYTGLWYDSAVGWWYVENGAIHFNYYGLIPYGDAWWCVAGGRVAFEYTGLWYDHSAGWWYVENGAIHFGYHGLIPYGDAWWCVAGGRVAFEYTGLWFDPYVGWWYVENGAINFGYDGTASNEFGTFNVAGGAVVF